MRFRLIASVLFAATFVVQVMRIDAQDYRARLQGIVTDSSQAAIPGASATLLNVNTGVQTVRHTNETGRYVLTTWSPMPTRSRCTWTASVRSSRRTSTCSRAATSP